MIGIMSSPSHFVKNHSAIPYVAYLALCVVCRWFEIHKKALPLEVVLRTEENLNFSATDCRKLYKMAWEMSPMITVFGLFWSASMTVFYSYSIPNIQLKIFLVNQISDSNGHCSNFLQTLLVEIFCCMNNIMPVIFEVLKSIAYIIRAAATNSMFMFYRRI